MANTNKKSGLHSPENRIEVKNLKNLNSFFESIKTEINNAILIKFAKDNARQGKEMLCYQAILSKHRTLALRRIHTQIQSAQPRPCNDKEMLNLLEAELKNEVDNRINVLIRALRDQQTDLITELNQRRNQEKKNLDQKSPIKLEKEIDKRINASIRKLNQARELAKKNLDTTPNVVMEIEGELAFRMEHDAASLFTKTAYNNLGTLYNKVFLDQNLNEDNLKGGAKSIAEFMVNQSLVIDALAGNDKPIAEYQEKLKQAKIEQYRILERTISDMTERTQESYNKDLKDDLINLFVPDSAVISKFASTSFRTYGKDAIDPDLHRVFVLMMECDTEDDLALTILKKLRKKYFSEYLNDLLPEKAEANMRNFLSELVASLADVLNDQMAAGGGFKKPLLTKHLNNLLKKYNHPCRIGKKKISQPGEPSVFRLKLINQTRLTAQQHFEKKVLKPRIGLLAILVDILLGLGAGALTTAAFLMLPFSIPVVATVLIAGFIAVCSTYVNYRLYHRFFKPFAIRVATKGLTDALFGERAPLNVLKIRFSKMSLTGKIASVLGTVFIVGPLLAFLVVGFSAIVSVATMVSVVTTALSVVAGFPLLIIGAALVAATIGVLAFIVHLPLILIVAVDLALCIKGLGETVVNIIRGEKGDPLVAKILRGMVVVPLIIVAALLILPLVAATILTVRDFKQATISFGNVLRHVFNSPQGTALAIIGAITSFPGVLIMSLGGLFQATAKGLASLKNTLFSTEKKSAAEDNPTNIVDEIKAAKPASQNPWTSTFHRRLGHVKTFFKLLTLGGNGAGNGLIAGDAAPNKRLGLGVTIVAAFSSICSCALGFFGWNKAKVGEPMAMVKVDSTYSKLDKELNVDANPMGEEGGEVRANVEPEIEAMKKPDIATTCHAFFNNCQKRASDATADNGLQATNNEVAIIA